MTAKQLGLSDDFELVSAIYKISTSMNMEFVQPVTIEIQHCVREDYDHTGLRFIVCKSDSSCKFETMEEGEYPTNSSYGHISVTHFSEYGIVLLWRWLKNWLINGTAETALEAATPPTADFTETALEPATHLATDTTTEPRSYCAQIFYIYDKCSMWKIHFVIISDLEICKTVSFATTWTRSGCIKQPGD